MSYDNSKLKQHFEDVLSRTITEHYNRDCDLHRACKYALEGQGKRIRPLLTYLSFLACGGNSIKICDPAALAVEYIHTYSLMHDDLPCMDDDSERRGRPTTHVVFDQAISLVAGDSIMTDSFDLICASHDLSDNQKLELIACLSKASGKDGMCLGQGLDLEWTGREDFTKGDLDSIHINKTGKLIAAACQMGAICAKADNNTVAELTNFGLSIGLAFQVIDDLIDSFENTGKTKGKDLEQGKLTYLRVMSPEKAQEKAQLITENAFAILDELELEHSGLQTLGRLLLQRKK